MKIPRKTSLYIQELIKRQWIDADHWAAGTTNVITGIPYMTSDEILEKLPTHLPQDELVLLASHGGFDAHVSLKLVRKRWRTISYICEANRMSGKVYGEIVKGKLKTISSQKEILRIFGPAHPLDAENALALKRARDAFNSSSEVVDPSSPEGIKEIEEIKKIFGS